MAEKDYVQETVKALSSEQKAELESSKSSTYSGVTTLAAVDQFVPGSKLTINLQGISVVRLPLPSSELKTTVTDSAGKVAYVSTRHSKCSGNCVLSSPDRGDLIATEYRFGPGRDPKMVLLPSYFEEADVVKETKIKTTSRWTSRSQSFLLPDGKVFEWRYAKYKALDATTSVQLVLQEKREGALGRMVAVLVRNEETRTPGSSKSSAGNGGQLILDSTSSSILEESVIIASCLLMLKKEIDRRTAIQFWRLEL